MDPELVLSLPLDKSSAKDFLGKFCLHFPMLSKILLTDSITNLLRKHEVFSTCVAPEGIESLRPFSIPIAEPLISGSLVIC